MGKHEVLKWPYPVAYGRENRIITDVLILGGGTAGLQAAISAARKGTRVTIVEKADVITSGSGGAGCDHWQFGCNNPCSKVTPEEYTKAIVDDIRHGYTLGLTRYIAAKEGWDTLLEMEKLGTKIRDSEDEFKGADFRDEETKLLFAYDYVNRHTLRWWGNTEKPALIKECKRLGVQIYNRVAVTSLLTTGNGEQGTRVIGATAVNTRTGEFYIFRAKAVVSCLGFSARLGLFSTEIKGFGGSSYTDPNCVGEGLAMSFRVGALCSLMESGGGYSGPFSYPEYGTGDWNNTWARCTVVDADGKEIPWVDKNGRILKTVSERSMPTKDQKFILDGGGVMEGPGPFKLPDREKWMPPTLIRDLPERIKRGEFKQPLYADLSSMPKHERRAIFGLMVGQEGKTKIPIYFNYTRAGFDPDKDMLEVPVQISPEDNWTDTLPMWLGPPIPKSKYAVTGFSYGGVVVDWDLRSSIKGLYAAGSQLMGFCEHAMSSTTGRYAGRKAAEYALVENEPVIDERQVEAEKARVHAPTSRRDGMNWKELNAGIARIMQEYSGGIITETILKEGLRWLGDLKDRAAESAFARNPHELMRVLECFTLLTLGEMALHSSLSRKASSLYLMFFRLDYPDIDPPAWQKFTTIGRKDGKVVYGELPLYFWLKPPYASSYEENYQAHCSL